MTKNRLPWQSSKFVEVNKLEWFILCYSLDIWYNIFLWSLFVAMCSHSCPIYLVSSNGFYWQENSRSKAVKIDFPIDFHFSWKIGAGTSLPGLVAAKIGAQDVILCDNPKVDRWLPLIRETLASNSLIADRIHLESLDWYDEKSITDLIEKSSPHHWDFILGSDIFFHKKGQHFRMSYSMDQFFF